jgi:3D (Asp-Asp-Asp) domain-containing protein
VKAKLNAVLYIITIIIIIMLVIGYRYNKQQHKAFVQQPNEKIQRIEHHQEIKKIDTETDKEVDTQAVKPVSIGEFKLTAYCSCEICCGIWANNRPNGIVYGAIGEELKEGYSIAVDPNVIPYKTEVIINGNVYKAQDCGGAIKGNRIDVYFENHNDALEFGVQYAEVFLKTENIS